MSTRTGSGTPADPYVETFDSSDTWTVPEGVTEVIVEAWGAGSDGSTGLPTASAGGGGGGAYARSVVQVTPGQNYDIVVGAGGQDGGDSTFAPAGGAAVVVAAGAKQSPTWWHAGEGGQAADSIGDVTFSGGDGGTGSTVLGGGSGGGGGASAGPDGPGANGQDAADGGAGGVAGEDAGSGGDGGVGVQGDPGTAPGGGGGGGGRAAGPLGGAGADGRVRLTYIIEAAVKGEASIEATATLTATGTLAAHAAADVDADGAVTATAKVAHRSNPATVSATATIEATAQVSRAIRGAASVSAQGTISASGSRIRRFRPGQPLHWLGGPIDVRVEIDTGLAGATFGIWDQSAWDAATWGAQDPDWADITEFVEQVSIDQGKERWEQRFGAGVAQIILDNTRGYFTPEIVGPFHLPFRPGRRIRVVAIPDLTADPHSEDYKVPLFTGTIDSSNDRYDEAGWNIRTVLNCVDFMALWQANNPLALENPTGVQSTDARVDAALDRVGGSGWPEDLRDIQEGLHTMQTSSLAQSTAEECHRAAEAEGGAFFCSKDGKATFKARDWLKGGVTEEDQVTETLNTSGTWQVPDDVFFVQVECWGGGGGGGAADPGSIGYPMGGGGGGGYAQRTISVTPSESLTITVGKGGAGGDASAYPSDPAYNGQPGGDTSVYRGGTRLVEAFGGGEGSTSGGRGGGGYAPGGTVRSGGDGGSRHAGAEGGGGGGGSAGGPSSAGLPGQDGGASTGGAGGANTSGGGAGGDGGDVGSTPEVTGGQAGTAPGGGGGGSGQDTTSDQGDGGDGADGRVVLTYTPNPAPTDPRSIQVQGYLGYDDSELSESDVRAPVLDFRVSWEMARIRNDIQFSRVGGSVQHKWDDPSIAASGRRSYRRLDLYNNSDDQVALLAERALAAWKDSRLRVDEVTIGANRDPQNEDLNRLLWDTQFGDLLAVKVKTPYGWEYEKEVHIMGIRHLITPNDWIVTFTLDDAAAFQQEED